MKSIVSLVVIAILASSCGAYSSKSDHSFVKNEVKKTKGFVVELKNMSLLSLLDYMTRKGAEIKVSTVSNDKRGTYLIEVDSVGEKYLNKMAQRDKLVIVFTKSQEGVFTSVRKTVMDIEEVFAKVKSKIEKVLRRHNLPEESYSISSGFDEQGEGLERLNRILKIQIDSDVYKSIPVKSQLHEDLNFYKSKYGQNLIHDVRIELLPKNFLPHGY